MSNVNSKIKRYTLAHYLFGALPARLGDEMSGQAILLIGITAGSAALGSTLLAGLTFSAAVGGPLLGAILDRSRNPGRVLALALGLYAVGIALVAWSLGSIPIWLSIAITLAAGFLMPSISGGWSSRLKSFIADEQMTRTSAIDAMTFNIAGLAGPALAGLIAAWFGAHWAVVVLVTLLATALPMAWLLPKRDTQAKEHDTSFLQDVPAGLKAIVANKPLLRITVLSVVSYMSIGMLWVACPLVGLELLGNAGFGSVMMSVLSVGALVATATYARWPSKYTPDTIAFATTIMLAAAMLVLTFADIIWIALAAMLIAGLADGPQLAAVFAVRHRESPERFRSQVFTTGASLKITAAGLGAALAGPLAARSLVAAIAAAAFVQMLAAVIYLILCKTQPTTPETPTT